MNDSNVYVVTRNNRRIEDLNYPTLSEAEIRADKLRKVLKRFDPNDIKNVSIKKTKKPHQIR
tara:strand:+ start:165 stop:350 length:186 start_codon:yes stop_codon:yes gene_type:complete